MTTKIKALWLPSWYPNRAFPIQGNFIKRQLHSVMPFCEVSVLFVIEIDDIKQVSIEINDDINIQTMIAYIPKKQFLIFKFFYYLRAYFQLYQRLNRTWGKPDIIHLNVIYPAGLFCLILHLWQKIPFIISEHSSVYRPERQLFKGFFLKNITRLCIKWARRVIVLTEYNADIMQNKLKLYNNHYQILPNVVDTNLFTLPKEENLTRFKKKPTVFTFLHVSGLHDSIKNITGILNSIAKLVQKRQDFKVIIVGDIEEQEPYWTLAKQHNIFNSFVFFSPEISIIEVSKKMQQADAFLMFSNVEGLPCVILEAMSAGLPIVATETGGILDWVASEFGVLVNIGNEAGLAEAMDYVIDNKDKYDPSVIRSRIVDKCSVEVVGKAIVSVYSEVLGVSPK